MEGESRWRPSRVMFHSIFFPMRNLPPPGAADYAPCSPQNWTEVTSSFLKRKWEELHSQRFNGHKLWFPWWAIYMLKHCLATP